MENGKMWPPQALNGMGLRGVSILKTPSGKESVHLPVAKKEEKKNPASLFAEIISAYVQKAP